MWCDQEETVKALTIFGACFLVLLALLWARTESYFPLYPLIDTRLPQGFSEQKFKQITPGMSKAEVAVALPGSPESGSTQWQETYWFYGNDGGCYGLCDLAWVGFTVQFDEAGNVTKTERSVFAD
jgi:outer membrane protein assembly factor BamE (lipoprotein component of BamABCDE complex)